jgi:hypothetical protein
MGELTYAMHPGAVIMPHMLALNALNLTAKKRHLFSAEKIASGYLGNCTS